MAETDLPEGTDKVVSGAMETEGPGGARKPRSRNTPARTRATASSEGIMDKVRSSTDKLSGQAADKARDLLRQGMSRSAEAIGNVAGLVGDTATGIDENIGEDYGDYARKASESLRDIADRLAAKDPDELIDDTRRFVRKSPAVALAGAAIVGFALARLVKAGFANDDESDSDD